MKLRSNYDSRRPRTRAHGRMIRAASPVSGKRIPLSISPILASTHLTGIGLARRKDHDAVRRAAHRAAAARRARPAALLPNRHGARRHIRGDGNHTLRAGSMVSRALASSPLKSMKSRPLLHQFPNAFGLSYRLFDSDNPRKLRQPCDGRRQQIDGGARRAHCRERPALWRPPRPLQNAGTAPPESDDCTRASPPEAPPVATAIGDAPAPPSSPCCCCLLRR